MATENLRAGRGVRRLARPSWLPRLGRWEVLLLPALALAVLAFAIPVGTILARAFTDHTTDPGIFGNLQWFVGNETQVKVLIRTFETAGAVTLVCLLVSYPFAYLLTIAGRRWQILLLGLVVISAWQSLLVRNYGWRIIFRDNGPLNDVLDSLGLGHVSLYGTTAGVIIAMSQVWAPFMILPLYACLRGIDRRLLLAARSLGANPITAFVKVYLPLSVPGAVAGGVLVAVLSLGEFITPALVGSTQNALLPQAIQLEVGRTLNWGHVGAQSVVLLASVVAVIAAVKLLSKEATSMLSPTER